VALRPVLSDGLPFIESHENAQNQPKTQGFSLKTLNPVSKNTRGTGPRPLADVLQSGDIATLLSQAAERRKLVAEVRSRLAADEAEHVVCASMDAAGRLVLGVDSAAWAARVRYRARELGRGEVHVRVVPKG
jgi:hypothetical protein